jgi:hypothetical protein
MFFIIWDIIYSGRHESTLSTMLLHYEIFPYSTFHLLYFIYFIANFHIDIILFQQKLCAPSKIISNIIGNL